ncbi:MAG: Calx-beta domain-containing protein [Prevotella sp.]
MRIINKITFGLIALAAMAFSSCSNDLPEFNNADAFVALRQSTATMGETSGENELTVLLTSLGGKEGSVDFEIVSDSIAPAVEGTDFQILNESKTLKFTKEVNEQVIKIKVIDNDVYTGDKRFTINLVNAQGVNIGAEKSITVTIEDDEHPLAFMLGTYAAKGPGYFDGGEMVDWTVKIAKDDSDVSKVWITNMVPNGSNTPIYGTVNDAKDEIRIPVKQDIVITSSYPHVFFEAWYGVDGDEDVEDFVVGHITVNDSGKAVISFPDYWFGSHVYKDDAASVSAGWYEIIMAGAVFTLQ